MPGSSRLSLVTIHGPAPAGLVRKQNLPLTCEHDEAEPASVPAVNSNYQLKYTRSVCGAWAGSIFCATSTGPSPLYSAMYS